MPWKVVLDFVVYVVVRVLIAIVQAMRLETAQGWARGLAWLFADVLRVRGDVADENLRHAFAELSDSQRQRLVRRMWNHLFLLVVEVAHAPRRIHDTNWRRYVRLREVRPLVAALLSGRPVLIVTAHFGNFEVGGFMLGILGFPTYTVARPLDNPYLDRFISRFRGATGQYIIPNKGGYDQILAVMARGGTMSLLADQYASRKGCWVQFFGRPASAHKAIALLALDNDAVVASVYARRLEHPMRWEMACTAMADPTAPDFTMRSIPELTQWYTTRLEEFIRECPDQYWWIHRRWKQPRNRRRRKAMKAA